MKEQLVKLTRLVMALQQERLQITGEITVLISAVHALIRTHHAPDEFAKAFRSAWRQLGDQHADGDASGALLAGIDQALGTIEEACPVPLKVRPPRGVD